jgi:hypothetical protein
MTKLQFRIRARGVPNLLIAILAIVCFVGVGTATAQTVPAGMDCWETDAGTTAGIPDLPAGFFFPGSDPRPAEQIDVVGIPLAGGELADCACEVDPDVDVVWVDMHGDPVEPDSVHRVTQIPPGLVDTCVRRKTTADFPGGTGVPDAVDIEIVQLHLESTSPIVVTGPGPPLWDVRITEDGAQATGTLLLTAASLTPTASGGMDLTDLPVDYLVEFLEVGGPGVVSVAGTLHFENPTGGNFQVKPIVPVMGPAGPIAVGLLIAGGFAWFARRRTSAV